MTTALVIEDDANVRGVVNRLLAVKVYEGIESAYGQARCARVALEKPDIVLLDLMMPVMDGFDVLAKLKNHRVTGSMPVIILIARIDAESEGRWIRSGAVDYIKKNWGPGELEDRIAMALGYRGRGRQQYPTHVFHQNC